VTHLLKNGDELGVAGHNVLGLAVEELIQLVVAGGRRWVVDGEQDAAGRGDIQRLEKGNDVPGEIRDVVDERDGASRWVRRGPLGLNGADVTDTGALRVRLESGEQGRGGIDVNDLAAEEGQREAVTAGAAADVDDHVVGLDVRREDLEIGIERPAWIGDQQWVVLWETREEVAFGLCAAQACALGQRGVDAGAIGVDGRLGRHGNPLQAAAPAGGAAVA
jgi:hypothetical protein